MPAGNSNLRNRVRFLYEGTSPTAQCSDYGLSRHDPDAVRCKHCGHLLHIPTEDES